MAKRQRRGADVGTWGDPRHECRCSPAEIERYRNRVSGPLLDRIDLHVEVPAVTLSELKGSAGEPTKAVVARVMVAREIQERRLADAVLIPVNATMNDSLLRRHCRLEQGAQKLLDNAFDKLRLSARALHRILKVARTIADLAGRDRIRATDIAEAIQYRALDWRMGG